MSNLSQAYIAVILTQYKSSQRDLYPLSKNYPLALLPIGNKKLIIYQLEALGKIQLVDSKNYFFMAIGIIIEINQNNQQIEEYITKVFLIEFPEFKKKIEFYYTIANQNNFLRLLAVIQHIYTNISLSIKGLILTLCDTIFQFNLPSKLIKFHQQNHSDLSLLLKKKKQFNQNDKKIPQAEIQTEIDNVFIGQNNEVLFIDMLQQYQNNGVKVEKSLYKRVKKGGFKKCVDSKVYVFGGNMSKLFIVIKQIYLVEIIRNLNSSQIDDIKPWLIQSLVENQTNKRLLQLNKKNPNNGNLPLSIFCLLTQQDTFIKKINTKKVYQSLNFDSLVRGNKQKQTLLPTQFSNSNLQNTDFKGNLIMKSSIINNDVKITRSCIENNCKIGKKVEILRSVIMGGVEIRDKQIFVIIKQLCYNLYSCKIYDSIIGPDCIVGENCSVLSSYIAGKCRIPDGSKLDNEVKIPLI